MRYVLIAVAIFLAHGAAAAEDRRNYRLLKLQGAPVKWGGAEFGESADISYFVVTERHDFADARNCRAIGPVAPMLADNNIEANAFSTELHSALAAWQSISGVRFRPAASATDADILIGADLTEQGWAHADVKFAPANGEIHTIKRGLVCMSPAKSWKVGFGANADAQDLKYTLTHEIGHAIGLNHASPRGQLMSFTYGEEFSGLQPGDIEGARILYGAPREDIVATLPEPAGR